MDLSASQWALLVDIEECSWHGRGKRVTKCPDRDRLKRLGLIFSSPPNAGYSTSIAGHRHMWRPTEAGLAALKARTAAAAGAGASP